MSKKLSLPSALAAGAALSLTLAGCGGNLGGGSSDAADFPSQEISITVGAAAGGSTDLIARALAEGAADDLGVAVPVINAPGANGALAANQVAAADPTGYDLATLNASLFTITPLAVGEDEAVDLDQFEIIAGVSQDDYVLVANPDTGISTVADLEAAPETLSFGTTGVGTGSQLAQSLLLAQSGIEYTEVPFDSGAPAVTAVLGNQVNLATVQLGEAKAQIDAGELVPVLVFSQERNQFLADVPTAAEEGYDIPVSQYRAIAAPAGTPEEVVSRLDEAFRAAMATDTYKQFNEQNLLTPHEITGAEVEEEWTSLAEQYAGLVEEYDLDLSD